MTTPDPITIPHPAKLRVADFLTLAEAGAFDRYARAELIEGEIWVVNAIHTRHAGAHFRMGSALAEALKPFGSTLQGFSNPSTHLSELSLPEPDLAVGAPHDERKPLPLANLRIAIEIADATLDTDLGRKARLYAAHSVPEYWVVDLDNLLVHQLWSPKPDGYVERHEIKLGEPVWAATIGGLSVETAAI